MASAQNNLIVIPGGMLKSHSVKLSARQHRQIERFCRNTGWTAEEAVKDALKYWFESWGAMWEQRAEREGLNHSCGAHPATSPP